MNVQSHPSLSPSSELKSARAARHEAMQTAVLSTSVVIQTFTTTQAAAYRGYGAEVLGDIAGLQGFGSNFPALPGFGVSYAGGFGGYSSPHFCGFPTPMGGFGFPGYGYPALGPDPTLLLMMMMMQQDMMMQMLLLMLLQQQGGDQVTPPKDSCDPLPGPADDTDHVNEASEVDGACEVDSPDGEQDKKMTPVRAAEILKQYFNLLDTAAGIGERDGLIGRIDLEEALKNPDIPEELRQAIEYLLRNPMMLNALDVGSGVGKVDGLISLGDLDSFIREHKGKPGFDQVDEDEGVSGSDEPEDLEESGEVDEGEGVDQVEEAGDTEADHEEVHPADLARVMLRFFDQFARAGDRTRNGSIELKDLRAVAEDESMPQELRDVANYFLENPEVFREICSSGILASERRASRRNIENYIRNNS